MKLICQLIRWIYLKCKQRKTEDHSRTTSKRYSLNTQIDSGRSRVIISKCHLKTIRLKRENFCTKLCVYKIWFGNKYYIGSTVDINARMKLHLRTIQACFDGVNVGSNSQTIIMKHLLVNPNIKEGLVEIISFVKSEYDLVDEESKWLTAAYNDRNCLNYSNNTARKIKGTTIRPK